MSNMSRKMTKEDWAKVRAALESPYGSAKIECDGYQVSLHHTRIKWNRAVVMLYVDGSFEGRWMLDDCEERRRFFCPSQRNVWPEKMRKGLSKKRIKEMDLDAKVTLYSPYWKSIQRMISHLKKNNAEISLIEASVV